MGTRIQQAGAVAVRQGKTPRFLLVTARRTPTRWIFPKGRIEPGESVVDAALRELEEEAGVTGKPLCTLDVVRFPIGRRGVEIRYVLVAATNDGEEREGRRLKWLKLDEALEALSHDESRALLKRAARHVK